MGKAIQSGIRCSLLALLLTNTGMTVATEKEVDGQVLSALQEELLWLKEEKYVTTATKTLEEIKKSGATVSVITSQELDKMGARNLMDALKSVPGFGINQFNIGMPTVEVRGVKTDFSEKVLFLINGQPNNNNLVNGGGTWVYESFIVDEIKQVEIVRGPGSALYGANAFVAVINIITKTADDIGGAEVTLGAGSYDTSKLNIQMGKDLGGVKLAVNANVTDTDGFEGYVASDSLGMPGQLDSWVRRYDLGFNVSYENYSLQGKYVDRSAGSYAGIANALNTGTEQHNIEYFLELGYSRELASDLNVVSKLYIANIHADTLWQFFPASPAFPQGVLGRTSARMDRAGGEIQTEYELGVRHKMLVGLMLEYQSLYDVRFINNYDPFTGLPTGVYEDVSDKWNWNGSHSRDIHALFIQDIWDIRDNLRLIAGARYDDYSDFGSSFNPRTSLTWGVAEHYNIVATYGSAFRAPTFGELYNINNPSIVGNPDVQPEEIETFEFGVNGDITKRLNFRVTGFRNNITDLIAPTPSDTAVNVSDNVGELTVNGVELEMTSRLRGGSSLSFNYTYQHPINELTGERAPDVPLHKANASFNYRHSKYLNGFIGLLYRGSLSRAENDPRADVSAFATLDLALIWQNYVENLEVKASIYNATDKQYFDASPAGVMLSDYPKPGRNFMVEVSYKL